MILNSGKLLAIVTTIMMLSVSGAGALKAGQLEDAQIIGIYNQVNSIDIETALLGQINGYSEDVRSLAKMVATDHTGVRKAVQDLANELKIVPVLPAQRNAAARSHYEVIAALREKTGEDFDRAYLLHEIKFHTEAMDAVKKILLPNAKNPKIQEHFNQVLPHFQHHLNETIRVAKKLKVIK